MKDNVFLILTKFTTIISNTIIAMLFASMLRLLAFCAFVAGWRHALRSEWSFIIIIKVININSPGSNPKSNHINIHIVIDPHTHVFVILNIAYHIYFVNPINLSAHSISYAGVIWITVSMHIPSLHINSVKCLSNLQLGKGDTNNNINGILCPYIIRVKVARVTSLLLLLLLLKSQGSILGAEFKAL